MPHKQSYIPDAGDVVWITMNPQAGHEQAGRRPALVVSPVSYNRKVGLSLLCPITSQIKGYPFEVPIPPNKSVGGAVLADQVKSLDWKARNAAFICKLPTSVLQDVMKKLALLLPFQNM